MVSAVLMNISPCVQPVGTNPSLAFFLITDSVRSLPMELGAMTHGKLHFRELIWCAVKWKCSQYRNAFALSNLLAGQKDHEEIRGEAARL